MNAFLLRKLQFEDLLGKLVVLPIGASVTVDAFDDTLVVVAKDQLEYIVPVSKEDYRKLQEMN